MIFDWNDHLLPTSSKRFYFGPIYYNKTSICWDIMSLSLQAMSATHLRWALSLAARRAGPSWTASPRALQTCGEEKGFLRGPPTAPPGPGGHFSTEAGETPPAAVVPPPKKKKQDPNARTTINSVGRKIHQRLLQVMGVGGERPFPLKRKVEEEYSLYKSFIRMWIQIKCIYIAFL